ncbi:MAG: hypothetical protein GEU73_16420 [Chloroflexi bacterium]|nr:hypothetical protein [Chloroflexota bacterium]
MRVQAHVRAAGLIVALLLMSCTSSAQPASPSTQSSGSNPPAAPKRISIAILGELPAFWDDINPAGGTVPGIGQFEGLASSGLTVADQQEARYPQLAEAVPSTENGLWQVFPDGRMETTWRIREGARWHDGQPFTSEDLAFTATVGQDDEMTVFRNGACDLVESVETPDARTVTVAWKRPYIRADTMFSVGSAGFAPPLPKHILEEPFTQNKATFTELAFWTTEFVGSGAFKLREWAAGSHVLLDAFPDYVLGRPKIDQIEVRFIPDPSTLLANVLAGIIDLTFSRSVSIEQAVPVRDQWLDGKMIAHIDGWTMMYPQLRSPTPSSLGDPQFRRALISTIDRQQLADTLTAGLAPIADSIIAPVQPEYRSVEPSIVRYSYDPNRAAQLLEGMGLTKGADGTYHDAANQRISVEIRTTTNDANQKATLAVADYLQRAGIGAEPVVIPVARLQDREYRSTYPGLELVNQPHGVDGFEDLLHSSAAPLPERNYRAPKSSRNRGAYMNPEYDALMERYKTTIPLQERMQVLGQLLHQQTDLQLVMGVFYTADAIMMANRLTDAPPATTWNAHEWDVTS